MRTRLFLALLAASACGPTREPDAAPTRAEADAGPKPRSAPKPRQPPAVAPPADEPADAEPVEPAPTPAPEQKPDAAPAPAPAPDPKIAVGAAPDDYLDEGAVKTLLQSWAAAAPHVASYAAFGEANGYETVYLRLSRGVSDGAARPKVLINAAVHGDEAIATATVLGVMHRLLAAYDTDPRVRELVETRDLYFVPITCPDGYDADSREVEGRDPNRSYPWPGDPDQESVACVAALRELHTRLGFNATIDYHASGRMWLLPWGYKDERIDVAAYARLGEEMAALNGYRWGAVPDMVGYIAAGSAADYFHLDGQKRGLGTLALGAEVGRSKRPPPRDIPVEVEKNYAPLLLFMEKAPTALRGGAYADWRAVTWPRYEGLSEWFVPGAE